MKALLWFVVSILTLTYRMESNLGFQCKVQSASMKAFFWLGLRIFEYKLGATVTWLLYLLSTTVYNQSLTYL